MDDYMGIAALSVGMNQAQAQQGLGVSVLKMAMDASAESVEAVLNEAAISLDANLGGNIDILA